MNDTAPSPGSVAFADASSGHKYFDNDAHYQSLALGVLSELDQNIGLILLTGSPPPDTDLFARHLERECAPKRYVRIIHGRTVTSVVSLVVAADISSVLVVDPPADIAGEILHQLSWGPSSDDRYRAAVVLLGPDSLARGLRVPGSKDGKSAMPAWLRFRHLARHEVEPFIRFQMNDAHLDQSIFKAPLVSLIESYADGDPAVVNSLADEILTATQGTLLESFAEVVADLTRQIGAEIRHASRETSPTPAQAPPDHSSEVSPIAPVAAVEGTAQPLEKTDDSHVGASLVAPAEMVSEATGSSQSIAADDTASIPAPDLLPKTSSPPVVEPHRFVAPEDGAGGSSDDSAMQDRVTSHIVAGTDELLAPPAASAPVIGGSTEGHSGSPTPAPIPPANQVPAASPPSLEENIAGGLTDPAPRPSSSDRLLLEAAARSEGRLTATPPAEASAFEVEPEAATPEPLPLESNRLPLAASPARLDEVPEPDQEKSRAIPKRRKWIIPTGIAASIVIAFGAAFVSSLEIGPAAPAWFARAAGIANDVKLILAPAPDGSREPALAGSTEQRRSTGERSTTIPQTIDVGSPSEASGDRPEQPMAAAPPAEPNVAGHSPSKASSNRREQPIAAAPPAEPNVADHSPSGRVEVAAQAPIQETPAQETVTVVAPIGSPPPDPVVVAARSEPQPLPAPPIAKAVLPSPGAELFLQRGDQLMAQGDIVPARQFFERAAEGGAAGAAVRLAKSYDPIYLRRAGVRGVAGDAAKATQWYEKAIASGDIEAELALLQLRANSP